MNFPAHRTQTLALYTLLKNAKKINLWHGIGTKKIASNSRPENAKFNGLDYLYREIYLNQNDFLLNPGNNQSLIDSFPNTLNINLPYPRLLEFIDSSINEKFESDKVLRWHKSKNLRKILYAPTWISTQQEDALPILKNNLMHLMKLATENSFLLGIKLHPKLGRYLDFFDLDKHETSNVFVFDSRENIQSLLRTTHLLMTDYSSVFSDFLYFNRPIIFLNTHQNIYESTVDLIMDFESLPGVVINSCYELDKEILFDNQEKLSELREDYFERNLGKKPNLVDFSKWIEFVENLLPRQ